MREVKVKVKVKTRECPVCGAGFSPANNRQRYCSPKCRRRAKNRRDCDRVKASRAAARAGRACAVCGKPFTPKNSRGKYCSVKCANANRYHGHVAHEPKACEWCGREFVPTRKGQRFCSRECNLSSRGKGRKGDPISIRSRQDGGCPSRDVAKVRAYLALPPAERWAKRSTLTQAELKLASQLWVQAHGLRTVETNDLMH